MKLELGKFLITFAVNIQQLREKFMRKYAEKNIYTLSKIDYIKNVRKMHNEKYGYLPTLKECKDIADCYFKPVLKKKVGNKWVLFTREELEELYPEDFKMGDYYATEN